MHACFNLGNLRIVRRTVHAVGTTISAAHTTNLAAGTVKCLMTAVCLLMLGTASGLQAAEPLPQVLLKTSKGDVIVELYEDQAPNTVAIV